MPRKPQAVASRSKKALDSRQIARIIAMWESGDYTLGQIGEQFDRTQEYLSKLLKKLGAKKGARRGAQHEQIKRHVENALAAAATQEAEIIVERIKSTKEDTYKRAEWLGKLSVQIIAKKLEAKENIGDLLNQQKVINLALQNVKISRDERYTVLGLNDEKELNADDLPDLTIQEMTADQIAEMQKRATEEINGQPGLDEGLEDIELEGEAAGELPDASLP